jgi:hypothetical protein
MQACNEKLRNLYPLPVIIGDYTKRRRDVRHTYHERGDEKRVQYFHRKT